MNRKVVTVAVLGASACGILCAPMRAFPKQAKQESGIPQAQAFQCNIGALTADQRASHKRLTSKLVATRNKIVETPKGYEFQFAPSAITLGELAEWANDEGKCCPFFDFHIDLEERGTLLCLRLTGPEGVKAFIRNEFQVSQ
jgi:hypothetical protein